MIVQLTAYAFNTHVHWRTNASSYSIVLSRQPPGLALLTASWIPVRSSNPTSPQAIRAIIQLQIAIRDRRPRRTRASPRKYSNTSGTDEYERLQCLCQSSMSTSTIPRCDQLPKAMLKQCRCKRTRSCTPNGGTLQNYQSTRKDIDDQWTRHTAESVDWPRDSCTGTSSINHHHLHKQLQNETPSRRESSLKADKQEQGFIVDGVSDVLVQVKRENVL